MSVEKPELATADTNETPLPFESTVTDPQTVTLVSVDPGAEVVGLVVDVELSLSIVVDVVIGDCVVGGGGGDVVEDEVVGVDVAPVSDVSAVVDGTALVAAVAPVDGVEDGPPWALPEPSTGEVDSDADPSAPEAGSWPSKPVVTVDVAGTRSVVEETAALSAGPVMVVTLLVWSGCANITPPTINSAITRPPPAPLTDWRRLFAALRRPDIDESVEYGSTEGVAAEPKESRKR